MSSKTRLDELLVQKGLAPTRSKAQALILSGQVRVAGQVVTKASAATDCDSNIQIQNLRALKYVSRGGLKLEEALLHFRVNVKDRICLDVGASTGGFSDCLLQSGAKFVYAVDVGYGQLHEKLRADPRVRNLEKINARYLKPEIFVSNIFNDPLTLPSPSRGEGSGEGDPNLAVIDVSFISLEKVLPAVAICLKPPFEILALVKPQFEAEKGSTKKGVIKEESLRLQSVQKIADFAEQKLGLKITGQIPCSTHGPKGNIEYFLYILSLDKRKDTG